MSRHSRGRHDPELVELFADDSESLAIVDAIAVTQKRRCQPTSGRRLATIGATVFGVAIAVGALTHAGPRAGVIERARQALPRNRAIELVIETPQADSASVNLHTGETSPIFHTISEWYDPTLRLYRLRDAVGGITVSDVRSRAMNLQPVATFTGLTLTQFLRTYDRLLQDARNKDVSATRVGGERAYVIRFSAREVLESVTVSAHTFRPIVITARDGNHLRRLRVLAARVVSTIGADLRPVRRALSSKPSSVATVTAQKATGAGLKTATTLSGASAGLASVREFHFTDGTTGGEFLYSQAHSRRNALPDRFIKVQESTKPEPSFGWTAIDTMLVRDSTAAVIQRSGTILTAFVRGRGRFFRVMTSEGRQVLLGAGRRLADTR